MKIFINSLLLLTISGYAKIDIVIDSQFNPCQELYDEPDLFCGLTGDVSQLSNGTLVFPMRGSVVTTDTSGRAYGHFNGSNWFVSSATELKNNEFLIGSWDKKIYHANDRGQVLKIIGDFKGAIWTGITKLKNGAYVFGASLKPAGSGVNGVGFVSFLDSKLKSTRSYKTSAGFFATNPIEMPNGNIVMVSKDSLIIVSESRGVIKELKLTDNLLFNTALVLKDGRIVIGAKKKLYFVSSKSGELLNTVTIMENDLGSVTSNAIELDNGNIVFSTNFGFTYFLDTNGKILAQHRVNQVGTPSEAMQMSNGLVVVGAMNYQHKSTKNLLFFDNNGALLKTAHFNAQGFAHQKALELKDGRLLAVVTLNNSVKKAMILKIDYNPL